MKKIKRIKEILKKEKPIDFESLLNKCQNIGKTSKRVAICPENTNENWLGIKNATLALYKSDVLVLPQFYSNQVVTDEKFKIILQTLKNNGIEKIIFSGLPKYFFKFISYTKNMGFHTSVHFHGGLAEFNLNHKKQSEMKQLFSQTRQGIIDEIIVVKEGLDLLFKKISGVNTKRIVPELVIPENLKQKKYSDGKIHIGVFGNDSYNKNRHTQVAAAALIENSIVHVIGSNEFEYLIPPERIKVHKQLDRKQFLELLGSMNINLYCSYSESWGQIVLESFALKTPCLFSNNSGIQKIIGKKYLVEEYDNPERIADKINLILNTDLHSISKEEVESIKGSIFNINNPSI